MGMTSALTRDDPTITKEASDQTLEVKAVQDRVCRVGLYQQCAALLDGSLPSP